MQQLLHYFGDIFYINNFPLNLSPLPFILFRDQADQMDGDISGPWESTDFQPQLKELQRLLDALNILYNAKKNALINTVSGNDKGQQE